MNHVTKDAGSVGREVMSQESGIEASWKDGAFFTEAGLKAVPALWLVAMVELSSGSGRGKEARAGGAKGVRWLC